MNIECNVEVSISPVLGRVALLFPHGYYDALVLLSDNRRVKKSAQVYVKLSPPKKPRTTGKDSQNHALNGYVSQICRENGDEFDDVKMEIKRRAIKRGYPFHTDSFGNVVPESESNASTVECSYLIEEAGVVAQFCNVVLKEI